MDGLSQRIIFSEADNRRVSIQFLEPCPQGSRLAVVFPGADYTCDRPLLYYATEVLLSKNYSVALIEDRLSRDEYWLSLSKEQRLSFAAKRALSVWQTILSESKYTEFTFVGKSLGTYGIASILESFPSDHIKQLVWLTPSLNDKWHVLSSSHKKSFVAIGAKDPLFETAKHHVPAHSIVFEDADHSLETHSLELSLNILRSLLMQLKVWLE